jgi:hypothetical protein
MLLFIFVVALLMLVYLVSSGTAEVWLREQEQRWRAREQRWREKLKTGDH